MLASLGLGFFPSDMERCLRFYIDALGFQMRERKDNYAFFGERIFRRPTKALELVIEVDDLIAERDRLVSNGYQPEDDIKLQTWGLEDFRLVDPDGYCEFCCHTP